MGRDEGALVAEANGLAHDTDPSSRDRKRPGTPSTSGYASPGQPAGAADTPGAPARSMMVEHRIKKRIEDVEDSRSLNFRSSDMGTVASLLHFFGMMVMLILGHTQDLLRRLRDIFSSPRANRTPPGYAPLMSDFDSFYTRRFYKRIEDVFNRPICSAPDSWLDVMLREPALAKDGETPCHKPSGRVQRCLNLASYNYLGFANQDPYCTPRVLETLRTHSASTCSSMLESGHSDVLAELQRKVAQFLGKEDAVVFGMGFATNSTVIPALVGKGCLVLSDALNHTSIVTGVRSSGASVRIFRHNDVGHLERTLRFAIAEGQPRTRRPWRKVLIIVEGIYSMEGETACLADIVALKKKYKAYLFLDEAHSIGAMGRTGRGCAEHEGVDTADIDVMMGTFTKSFGSCGGYIAGSRDLVEHIRRSSPGTLYAAAMSPPAAQQALSALKVIMGEDGSDRGVRKIQRLHAAANWMRVKLMDLGLAVEGDWDSPVIPVMLINSAKIASFSRILLERNIAAVVVGFPATALLKGRVRLCISAGHSLSDMQYALECIKDAADHLFLYYRKGSGEEVPSAVRAMVPGWERVLQDES